MKISVFEAEPREARAFDSLTAANALRLAGEPLRIANVGEYADAEAVSTVIYSELRRPVLEKLPAFPCLAIETSFAGPG